MFLSTLNECPGPHSPGTFLVFLRVNRCLSCHWLIPHVPVLSAAPCPAAEVCVSRTCAHPPALSSSHRDSSPSGPTAQTPWGLPSWQLGDLHEPFLSCSLFPGSTWAALYFVVLAAPPLAFRSLRHQGAAEVCLPGLLSCVGIGQGHLDRESHATKKEKEEGGHDPPEVCPQLWWPTRS